MKESRAISRSVLFVFKLLLGLAYAIFDVRSASGSNLKNQCGPLALHQCLTSTGVSADYSDVTAVLPPTGEQYSMAGLTRACDELGAAWAAVHWDEKLPVFESGSTPAVIPIALKDGRAHFLAILESRGERVLVADFPHPPAWVDVDDLRAEWKWDGTALHVAKDHATLEELVGGKSRAAALWWVLPAALFLLSLVLWPSRRSDTRKRVPRQSPGRGKLTVSKSGFTIIELLVGLAVVSLLLALIMPAVQSARERSRQVQCLNNLKQLGTACQNFESARQSIPGYLGRRPVGNFNAGGESRNLSPQAQLLPYLDQQPLFDRIDRREDGSGIGADPPGSDYNAEVMNTRVPVFICPSDGGAVGGVNYRGCTGTTPGVHSTIPETEADAARIGVFIRFDGLRLARVKDGLTQTVLFSERLTGDRSEDELTPSRDVANMGRIPPHSWNFLRPSDAVTGCRHVTSTDLPHWSHVGSTWLLGGYTQTLYNHILPPNSPMPDCGYGNGSGGAFQGAVSARSFHSGGVNVVFAGGEARFVNEDVDLEVWRALASIRGEEVVPDF